MIDLGKITERKEVIAKDIENVRARLGEYDKQKEKDTALLNALIGAFQQCDAFIKELDNDEAVEEPTVSDVENSSEED
jgi:hypothetical protein